MVDERQLTKDNKVAMYWRIAAMLVLFIAVIAVYYFILPVFFPTVVRSNVVDPQVLLRAYYHTEDSDERKKVFRRYMRYATEQNTDMAIKELESADEEHRIRAMHLLIRSNSDKCYEPLINIYRDTSRSQRERWKAIAVISVIGRIEPEDRAMVFDDFHAYDEEQLWVIYNECEKGLNAQDRAHLTEILKSGPTKKSYLQSDIIAMTVENDEEFLNLYLQYRDGYMGSYTKKRMLEYIDNDIMKAVDLSTKHANQLQKEVSDIIWSSRSNLNIKESLYVLQHYAYVSEECVRGVIDELYASRQYSQACSETLAKRIKQAEQQRLEKNPHFHQYHWNAGYYGDLYLLKSLALFPPQEAFPESTKAGSYKVYYLASILQSAEPSHQLLLQAYINEILEARSRSGSKRRTDQMFHLIAQRREPLAMITKVLLDELKNECGNTKFLGQQFEYFSRLQADSSERSTAESYMLATLLIKGPRVNYDGWVRKCVFLDNWYANKSLLLRLLFIVYHKSGYELIDDKEYLPYVKSLNKLPDWHARMDYLINEIHKIDGGDALLKKLVVVLTDNKTYTHSTMYGERDMREESMFKALIEVVLSR